MNLILIGGPFDGLEGVPPLPHGHCGYILIAMDTGTKIQDIFKLECRFARYSAKVGEDGAEKWHFTGYVNGASGGG